MKKFLVIFRKVAFYCFLVLCVAGIYTGAFFLMHANKLERELRSSIQEGMKQQVKEFEDAETLISSVSSDVDGDKDLDVVVTYTKPDGCPGTKIIKNDCRELGVHF